MANDFSQSSQSSPHKKASTSTVSSQEELSLLIQQTLTHIRNKQITLQEIEHTPRRMRKQLEQLKNSIKQVETFIAREDIILDPLNQAEHQQDLEDIARFVEQIESHLDNPSDIQAKINRLDIRNGFELLRRVLDEVQIETRSIDDHSGLGDGVSDVEKEIQLLQQSLKLQRQRLSRDTLGTPLGTSIAKRLNGLAGLLHRIDCLNSRSTLRRGWRSLPSDAVTLQLRPLVYQIDRAVDRLDQRETSAPELLEETEVFVERQLHCYEYPPGLNWLASRFSDINRSRSPQARVLLGLATSLSVTLVVFLALVGLFSNISQKIETDVSPSLRLEKERNEELQTLKDDVELLRQKEKELQLNRNALEDYRQQEAIQKELAAQAQPQTLPEDAGANVGPDQTAPELGQEVAVEAESLVPSTLETLLQEDQKLTSDIQAQRTLVDNRITNINALTVQIEEARETEQNDLAGNLPPTSGSRQPSPELATGSEAESIQNMKSVYSWLNNQQIINHLNRLVLAAFAGALGSMMSILIRLDKLDDENLQHPYALGCLKPFIGAVFGVIVFAILTTKVIDVLPAGFDIHEDLPTGSTNLQRRDPLGSIDSQEIYKIFVAAFIAGFSERLANDTLKPWVSKKSE